MKINAFFNTILGAPLRHPRWSWGAANPASDTLFLRIWSDQIAEHHNGRRVQIYWKKAGRSNGYPERLKQIEARRNAFKAIGIECEPIHLPGVRRKIKTFNEYQLLRLGRLSEDEDHIYATIVGKLTVDQLSFDSGSAPNVAEDIKAILHDTAEQQTTKKALIDARLGQGKFRKQVLGLSNHKCAVTSSNTIHAIRASHIKPWRDCNAKERLDPNNGIPLVATLDALFDAGLISFEASGQILISEKLSPTETERLGLHGVKLRERLTPATRQYLNHHRAKYGF